MNTTKTTALLPAKFEPWLVFIVVLASRIPWISRVSLGHDRDAWSTGLVAENMANTLAYEASRLPGYPFVEIVSSFFAGSPIWVFNLLTAIMSAVAATFFYLLLRQLHARHPLLLTFAFAFTVTVFIESLELMDYMWALAFVIGSFYYCAREKFVLCGLFLGLAVACRITSGALLLPLAIMSYESFKADKRVFLHFSVGFIIPLLVFFSPVFYTYGLSFFDYYGDNNHLTLKLVLQTLTVKLWGYPGAIGLMLAFGYGLVFRKKTYNKKIILVCLVVIVTYTLAFLKLPHETAYLLPAVPFVLILLDQWVANGKVLVVVCVLIGISSFINITPEGIFSPVLDDEASKAAMVKTSEESMKKIKSLAGNNDFILVAKHFRPMYDYLYEEMTEENTYRAVTCEELNAFRQKGVQIIVLETDFIDSCGIPFTDLSASLSGK